MKSSQTVVATAAIPQLFVLELNAGKIHVMNTDGSDHRTIVTDCHLPDGIVVDVDAGHIYWSNMGIPNLNDGSIESADIDGKNRKAIVARGKTHTPKKISRSSAKIASNFCTPANAIGEITFELLSRAFDVTSASSNK